jgi:hypothetical protein
MPGHKDGSINIKPIDREAFLTARTHYYIARKLNKNGTPVLKVAKGLGLEPI